MASTSCWPEPLQNLCFDSFLLALSSIVSELGFIVSFVWVRAIYRFLKSVCERLVRILSSCKVLPLSYFPEYIGLYQNIYTDWSNWFNIISITLLFSLCKVTCRGIFAKGFLPAVYVIQHSLFYSFSHCSFTYFSYNYSRRCRQSHI